MASIPGGRTWGNSHIDCGSVSGPWRRGRRRAGVGALEGFSFYPMGGKGSNNSILGIFRTECVNFLSTCSERSPRRFHPAPFHKLSGRPAADETDEELEGSSLLDSAIQAANTMGGTTKGDTQKADSSPLTALGSRLAADERNHSAATEPVCHDVPEQSVHQFLSNRGRAVPECCGRPGVNEASLPAERDAPGLCVSNGRGARHQSRRVHRHSRLGHRRPGPHAAWPR